MPCVLVSPDSVARFFPAAGRPVRPGRVRRGVADPGGRRGRRAGPGEGRRRRRRLASRCRRRRSPSRRPVSDDAGDLAETAVEDEESILTECVQARVPRQWLSWHYRSQDESLIAFSNAQYYENRLSSFPAPTHGRPSSEPDGRGVSLVRVPGTFHRSGAGRLLRTNPIEAKAIVAEIRRRFDLVPKSGTARTSSRRSASSPSTRSSGPTSRRCCATPTTTGWPRRSTAPTARACSSRTWRTCRATSATSSSSPPASPPTPTGDAAAELRAAEPRRRRAAAERRGHPRPAAGRVFSSFDPEQLRAEETSSVGIKHLRAYLDMAAQGTDVLPRDARSSSVIDRHREEIAAALRDARARRAHRRRAVGLQGRPRRRPRLVDPESPVMAVLLDGPAWARRGTVGDRDGLPVEVLGEMLRWPVVERVWLPSWLRLARRPCSTGWWTPVDVGADARRSRRRSRSRRRRSSRSRAWRRCARR